MATARIKIIQRVTEKSKKVYLEAPPLEIAEKHNFTDLEALMVRNKHRLSLIKRIGNVAILNKFFR